MKLKKWSNNHNIDAKIEVTKGKKNIKINKRFIFFCKRGICYDMSRDIMRKLK